MPKQIQVQWTVLREDAEWEGEETTPALLGDREQPMQWLPRQLAFILLVGLFLAVFVWGIWQRATAGLDAVERGLSHTLELEGQASSANDNLLATALLDPQTEAAWQSITIEQMAIAGESNSTAVAIIDTVLRGDRAMVRVRVTDVHSGAVYRESRFYRETTAGWLRSEPHISLWGRPRTFETTHFVFHFRELDRQAVLQSAPALDALYSHMQAVLGVPIQATADVEGKIALHVLAGNEYVGDRTDYPDNQIRVISPHLLQVPEQLSPSQILLEQITSALRRSLVQRTLTPLVDDFRPTTVLVDGLVLWLAWQEEGILADYRIELVEWIYEVKDSGVKNPMASSLPICQTADMHRTILEPLPMARFCANETAPIPPQFKLVADFDLLPLSAHQYAQEFTYDEEPYWPGQPIVMATLSQYITQTYGNLAVPDLLLAVRMGRSWVSICPQIFGVSPKEFEADWRLWLAEEYGSDR